MTQWLNRQNISIIPIYLVLSSCIPHIWGNILLISKLAIVTFIHIPKKFGLHMQLLNANVGAIFQQDILKFGFLCVICIILYKKCVYLASNVPVLEKTIQVHLDCSNLSTIYLNDNSLLFPAMQIPCSVTFASRWLNTIAPVNFFIVAHLCPIICGFPCQWNE